MSGNQIKFKENVCNIYACVERGIDFSRRIAVWMLKMVSLLKTLLYDGMKCP